MIVPDVSEVIWLLPPSASAQPQPTQASAYQQPDTGPFWEFDKPHPTPLPTVIPDLPEVQQITQAIGGTALWVAFGAMLITSIAFIGLSWRIPVTRRLYHLNASLVTLISTVAFLAMALHQGSSFIRLRITESHDHGLPDTHQIVFRQVFWARHVEAILTGPLLVANLGLVTGMSGAHIFLASLANVFMNVTALFATFSRGGESQKWTWYSVSAASFLALIYFIWVHGRRGAVAKGNNVAKLFNYIAIFWLVVATAYPLIWSISTGSRQISVNTEVIAYIVIDFLVKVVGSAWILVAVSRLSELGILVQGFWSDGSKIASQGRIRVDEEGEGSGLLS